MYKMILLPTDGSALSEKIAPTALDFARLTGGKIVALYVVQPYPFPTVTDGGVGFDPEVYEQQMNEAARLHLDKIGDLARAANIPFEGIIARSPSPYEEIVETAARLNCDIILMASHGRKGLNKLFLGSETQKVLAHTTLPVLVLR